MKLSSRYQAVIEIYDRIFKLKLPMDLIIGDYMRSRRYIGSKDRAFIAETAYQIMRHYGRLSAVLNMHEYPEPSALSRFYILTYIMCFDLQSPDLKIIFSGERYAPKPLSKQEQDWSTFLKQKKDDLLLSMSPHIQIECPDHLQKKLKDCYKDNFEQELKAFIPGASLDLRVNVKRKTRNEAAHSLHNDRVDTDQTPLSPFGLRCRDKVHLAKTKAFQKGWIEIQDEGSQLITLFCDAQPGMQILDYCAGGGGKTLGLAAMMNGKGRLVATDIDGQRLAKCKPRLKRAGLSDNVEVRALDQTRHARWLKRQNANFDVVLVDAPCSGSGTWRRNPDARYFTYGPDLETLTQTQSEILDKVASIPKVGGRLVYATCSILPEENEHQIEGFLNRHPDYEIVPCNDAWPDQYPCPDLLKNETYMRLSPYRYGTDGFFAAILKKVA